MSQLQLQKMEIIFMQDGWILQIISTLGLEKTDTSGNEIWKKLQGFTDRNHTGWEIKETNDSGFVVVGRTDFQEEDPYILKVDKKGDFLPPINVNLISEVIPKTFILSQNYPNPFNPSTNIRFDISVNGYIIFNVYNILGKLVFSNNGYKPTGSYEVKFDGSNLASGMYFYKLVVGDPKGTSKPNGVNSNKGYGSRIRRRWYF